MTPNDLIRLKTKQQTNQGHFNICVCVCRVLYDFYEVIIDMKPFYSYVARINQELCLANAKILDLLGIPYLGVPQAPSDKYNPAKQVLPRRISDVDPVWDHKKITRNTV